jgi:hypothetical protein
MTVPSPAARPSDAAPAAAARPSGAESAEFAESRPRPDWRETLTVATDLALLGIAITVAALPLVTAGAAVRVGSVVAYTFCVDDPPAGRPDARELWRLFRRSLLPGALAGVVAAAVAGLLVLDLLAVARGAVPGGAPVLALTAAVAAVLLGVAVLTVVRLGRVPTSGWWQALRWAASAALRRPGLAAVQAGVVALAGVLAVLLPITAPLLFGYALFATHAVAERSLIGRRP